jgi:hypothetical protein
MIVWYMFVLLLHIIMPSLPFSMFPSHSEICILYICVPYYMPVYPHVYILMRISDVSQNTHVTTLLRDSKFKYLESLWFQETPACDIFPILHWSRTLFLIVHRDFRLTLFKISSSTILFIWTCLPLSELLPATPGLRGRTWKVSSYTRDNSFIF